MYDLCAIALMKSITTRVKFPSALIQNMSHYFFGLSAGLSVSGLGVCG